MIDITTRTDMNKYSNEQVLVDYVNEFLNNYKPPAKIAKRWYTNSNRYRHILTTRIYGASLTSVGKELGMTRQRIHVLEGELEKKMYKYYYKLYS